MCRIAAPRLRLDSVSESFEPARKYGLHGNAGSAIMRQKRPVGTGSGGFAQRMDV
jgi:hypothetical protein